jgi:hypothetical protein
VATLAVPSAFVGVAFEVYGEAARAQGESVDEGSGIWAAVFVWFVLVGIGAARLRGWRETRRGDETTAQWLGVRDALRQNMSLTEAPPAAVAIWERLLAYGVGIGAAHQADAALPIGPTRDDEGWSPQRGLWRQVRIRYPKRFAYGERPNRVALRSAAILLVVAVGLIMGRELVGDAFDVAGDAFDESVDDADRQLGLGLTALFAALGIVIGFFAGRSLMLLWRAIRDLTQDPQTFEGYVVRVPWHRVSTDDGSKWVPRGYTAVDDGSEDEIRALRYYSTEIREGERVRVTVTPNLRHVQRVEQVSAPLPAPASQEG